MCVCCVVWTTAEVLIGNIMWQSITTVCSTQWLQKEKSHRAKLAYTSTKRQLIKSLSSRPYPRSCLKCLLMCRSVARLIGQLSWASNRQKAAETNERFEGKFKLEIVCRHKHWAGIHDVILFGKIIDSGHSKLQRVWLPSWPPAQACFW